MASPAGSMVFRFPSPQSIKKPIYAENIIQVSPSESESDADVPARVGSIRRNPARTQSPRSDRPRSPCGRNRGRSSPVAPSMTGKVEIFLRCEDLPKMDTFSSSDPICVLYVRRYGQWIEFGRTECIPNCLRPKFAETLVLDKSNQSHQSLKFSVFDTENLTSKDLHKHQVIGSIEVELFDLLKPLEQSNNNNNEKFEKQYYLKFGDQSKKRGKLCIVAEEVELSSINTNIKACLGALKLSRKGLNLFGKCDAYFELERKLKNDFYHPVYRSEVIFRNSEPRWKPFQISVQKLCNGNEDATVRISVYNFQTKGDHTFIGTAEATFKNMTRRIGEVKTLPLKKTQVSRNYTSDSKRGRNDSLSKAAIRILQCVIEEKFSLVDYVRGGCKISFTAAIDFSQSNGDDEDSLHSLESSVYEEALGEIVPWLCYYDPGPHHRLFGFAGILDGDVDNVACFEMTNQSSKKMFEIGQFSVSGAEELISIYRSNLPRIQLSGPTIMTPLIKKMSSQAETTVSSDQQAFHIALILTDGVCNDMQEVTDALEQCRGYPICFVFACLGPLRLDTIRYFAILEQALIKKCGRSIIHAFEFSEENASHSVQMARSAFAKISKDIVQYFVSRGIKPMPPQEMKSSFSPLDTFPNMLSPDFDGPLSAVDQDNWQNFVTETTSFCPTCGSHGSARSPMADVNIR